MVVERIADAGAVDASAVGARETANAAVGGVLSQIDAAIAARFLAADAGAPFALAFGAAAATVPLAATFADFDAFGGGSIRGEQARAAGGAAENGRQRERSNLAARGMSAKRANQAVESIVVHLVSFADAAVGDASLEDGDGWGIV
jgi:hypothetical protein